jgi:hypothetical protein
MEPIRTVEDNNILPMAMTVGDRTFQRFRIEPEPGRSGKFASGFTYLASRKDGTWPAKELQKLASSTGWNRASKKNTAPG